MLLFFASMNDINPCVALSNNKMSEAKSEKIDETNDVEVVRQQMMGKESGMDEQLPAELSKYEIIEPKLNCGSDKRINRMCLNPECQKPSLICQDQQCGDCGDDNHLQCVNIKLKAITRFLRKRNFEQNDFIREVCKIQNVLIEHIHNSRKELTKRYYLGDLEEKYIKIVEEIYKNKNTKCLTGKLAKQFYQRIIKFNTKTQQNGALLLDNYKNSMTILIDEMLDLKNRLYESFVKVSQLSIPDQCLFNSKILEKPLSVELSELKLYDSLIVKHSKTLVDQLAKEQKSFLMAVLNNPKKCDLLYRGSENGFSASTFHQKCDNIPNTLTIVRTEFGKTIAGFTQYTWNAVAHGNYLNEAGKNTFLLSLDLKQKMVPICQKNLIAHNTSYGPIFGSHDLLIADQCHHNRSSYANFPKDYNYEGQTKYTNRQDSYRAFSGSPNGYYFRVVEYEVFRVIY